MPARAEPYPALRGQSGQSILCSTTTAPSPTGETQGGRKGPRPEGDRATPDRGGGGAAGTPRASSARASPDSAPETRRPHRARPASGEGPARALHSPLMVAAGLAPSVRRTRSLLPHSPKPGRPVPPRNSAPPARKVNTAPPRRRRALLRPQPPSERASQPSPHRLPSGAPSASACGGKGGKRLVPSQGAGLAPARTNPRGRGPRSRRLLGPGGSARGRPPPRETVRPAQ